MDTIDRSRLTFDQLDILESRVIPTYKQWFLKHGFETNLFGHALDYLRKADSLQDPDIIDRYREWVRANDPKRRMSQADWEKHIRVLCEINPKKSRDEIIDRERGKISPEHLPVFIKPIEA